MTRYASRLLAGVLLIVASANVALAQSADAMPASIRVQVVFSRDDASGTPVSPSHTISFTTTPTGKFSADEQRPASFPSECAPTNLRVADIQRVGVRVEGAMSPMPDGRFQISFVITDRSEAGCRIVGALNIPVFANRTSNKDAVVALNETIPLIIGKSDNEAVKIEVRLTAEK